MAEPLIAPREKRRSIIDLTSLVDVVFILLVFFMVASKFAKPALNVELPEAAGKRAQTRGSIVLAIRGDKSASLAAVKYYIGKKRKSGRELPAALKAAVQAGDAKAIVIRADRLVPFQAFVTALNAAQNSGAVSVEIEHKP